VTAPASTTTRSARAPRRAGGRLHALDGLRGYAALAVFFSHALLWVDLPATLRSAIDFTPLGPLVNGPGAVHVFFVLSGYVMALSLDQDARPGRTARFYVRRWFRIHPPYVVAVLFAWAVSQLVVPRPLDPNGPWTRIPAERLPLALAFPSMAFGLLPVGWSLFVELAMSTLFPLLWWLARRVHPLAVLAIAIVCLHDFGRSWAFLRFTFDFAIGLVLYAEADCVAAGIARLPRAAPAVAAVVGLVLLQLPFLTAFTSAGRAGLEMGHSASVVVQLALGAGLLLVAALHAPGFEHALSGRSGRELGRVSYSFYLLHETVLLAWIMRVPGHLLPAPAALAFTVVGLVASLALAELGWRLVEQPSIRAGRAVMRGIARALDRSEPPTRA
jgi:peptidoglycan/LPS O-acetylase OafA/YrhL